VRAQTIGWNRTSAGNPPPPPQQGPWPGRLLGMLLLVLALAALYHGTSGQAVWRQLTGYLAGSPSMVWSGLKPVAKTTPTTASSSTVAVPESEILAAAAGDVAAAGGQIDRGEWVQADTTLSRLEQEWLRLSGMLAVDRVPVLDINNFTAILTDTQGQSADHNATAARSDVRRLMSEFDILALDFVGTQAPTFTELRDLSADLETGVRTRSWKRVSADAQALATIVQQIEQGY
jgi:hypothetical protein